MNVSSMNSHKSDKTGCDYNSGSGNTGSSSSSSSSSWVCGGELRAYCRLGEDGTANCGAHNGDLQVISFGVVIIYTLTLTCLVRTGV